MTSIAETTERVIACTEAIVATDEALATTPRWRWFKIERLWARRAAQCEEYVLACRAQDQAFLETYGEPLIPQPPRERRRGPRRTSRL